MLQALQLYRKNAIIGCVLSSAEQAMKDGIAVKSRQTAPADATLVVDQRAETTVSNDTKFKTAQRPVPAQDHPLRIEANRETPVCCLRDNAPVFALDLP